MTPASDPGPGVTLEAPLLGAFALAAVMLVALLARRRSGRALWFSPFPLLFTSLVRDGERAEPPTSWRVRLRGLPRFVVILATAALALALARPVVVEAAADEVLGIDVVLAFDVSSSMGERDLAGGATRLEIAREAATAFVAARPQDRFALLAFARFTDLLCPFTLDHAAVAEILAGLEPVVGEGDEDLTGIGAAAARAAELAGRTDGRSKVVVLLTDGRETAADAGGASAILPEHAAFLARDADVRVHVVAVGPPGGTDDDERARADAEAVRALAETTGGLHARAGDVEGLDRIYARIDRLERARVTRPRVSRRELRPLAILLGTALLAAAAGLRAGPLRTLP